MVQFGRCRRPTFWTFTPGMILKWLRHFGAAPPCLASIAHFSASTLREAKLFHCIVNSRMARMILEFGIADHVIRSKLLRTAGRRLRAKLRTSKWAKPAVAASLVDRLTRFVTKVGNLAAPMRRTPTMAEKKLRRQQVHDAAQPWRKWKHHLSERQLGTVPVIKHSGPG
jgi:hypothetical protein